MTNINHIVIVDRLPSVIGEMEGRLIMTAEDYINNSFDLESVRNGKLRVVNLCQNYDYLKTGYYCSLLADARGHRCIPSVLDVAHANWKRVYRHAIADLNAALRTYPLPDEILALGTVNVFFGRTSHDDLRFISRKVFDAFRMPAIRITFKKRAEKYEIEDVESLALNELKDNIEEFNIALSQFVGTYWQEKSRPHHEKYWMAILYSPDDPLPPSNEKALKKFISVGRKMGFYVELITRKDMDTLLEYDALFIRETTAVNNHTYRFAQKAESEGIPVIDDPQSILRCCNKVYLQELLKARKIKTPAGYFIYSRQKKLKIPEESSYPLVLKVPDGSFSKGVFRVNDATEFQARAEELFKKSELVLVQEFLPSDFDWRITLLGGKPLFACKYYMVKGHWQIYNHSESKLKSGGFECIPIYAVPPKVMKVACKAAAEIGDGLYGVDLKQSKNDVYVIEVNDNPNIDAGIEDKLLGDLLYAAIFDYFRAKIDA